MYKPQLPQLLRCMLCESSRPFLAPLSFYCHPPLTHPWVFFLSPSLRYRGCQFWSLLFLQWCQGLDMGRHGCSLQGTWWVMDCLTLTLGHPDCILPKLKAYETVRGQKVPCVDCLDCNLHEHYVSSAALFLHASVTWGLISPAVPYCRCVNSW